MANIFFTLKGNSSNFKGELWSAGVGWNDPEKIQDIDLGSPVSLNSNSGDVIRIYAVGSEEITNISINPEGFYFSNYGGYWGAELSGLAYVGGEQVEVEINPVGVLPANARTIIISGDGSRFNCSLWNSGGGWGSPEKIEDIPLGVETVILAENNVYLLFEIIEGFEVANILSEPEGWQAMVGVYPWDSSLTYAMGVEQGVFTNEGIIQINVKFVGETVKVSPLNKLHILTPEKIKELASFPMILKYEDGTPLNLSSFIINMLAIPFKLDPDLYLDETSIILSEFNTQILTPILKTDEVKISLGEIVVSNLFSNSLDYSETKYKLHFPFIKKTMDLEPDLVVNKTISSEYVLDCYTGDITINIFSDGELVKTESDKIGRNIPIRILQNVENNLSGFSGVLNDRMLVSMEVEKPVLVGGEMDNLVFSSGVISSVNGYLEVLEIDLKSKATSSEKQNIINLLKSGVFINA